MRKAVFIVAVLLALVASPSPAQTVPPGGQLFLVHEEIAKPSMLAQYEATNKEFIALVKQHRATMPHFFFQGYQGDDLSYTYFTPIPGIATLADISAEFGALGEVAGAQMADIFRRNGDAMDHWNDYVIVEDAALCYHPEKPRLRADEQAFRHIDFYLLKPGHEADADALAREFLALYKRKGITTEYHIFKHLLGAESPALIVSVGARDAADYAAQEAKDRALLGAEGETLFARAFSLVRRFETKGYRVRQDLVLPPPQ